MNISEQLNKIPLFGTVEYSAAIAERFPAVTKELSAGERYCVKNSIALLASGRAEVVKESQDKSTYLKTLKPPSLVGLATLFDESGGYISTLVAKTNAVLIVFGEDFIEYLIENDSAFALRFARLLCGKVRYLNQRIDFYTCSSAESKIYEFLVRFADSEGKVVMSMSRLAETLDIARASLYRAVSELQKSGVIVKDGKKIILLK